MIDKVIEILSLPDKAVIIRKITKKLFYDNAELNKREKDALVSEIESIRLIAMINEDSFNIGKFRDEDYDYTDIAVIYIDLRKNEKMKTIAKILHEAIPHPALLVLGYKNLIVFSTAAKRLNKIDTSKTIIEENNFSPWLCIDYPDEKDVDFINRLKTNTLPFENLYKFYTELDNRIYLTKAYSIFSKYPKTTKNIIKCKSIIKQIEEVSREMELIIKQQKQELNFGRKMDMQLKIKEFEKAIEELKNNLNEVV
jgi:hypothetical protein